METKNKPSPDGCIARALPDEPMFVLLARDECAPDVIRFWADQRSQAGVEGDRRQDAQQIADSIETADTFEAWREANDGRWRDAESTPVLALPERLTPELLETLGTMCFQLGIPAHVYQLADEFVDGNGEPMMFRAETEQAFMMLKMLRAVATHGSAWKAAIVADLDRAGQIAEQRVTEKDAAGG